MDYVKKMVIKTTKPTNKYGQLEKKLTPRLPYLGDFEKHTVSKKEADRFKNRNTPVLRKLKKLKVTPKHHSAADGKFLDERRSKFGL